MDDSMIINLYFSRLESAIHETDKKYHNYCKSIGIHILNNHEDTEECINDCYMNTWNAIPPQRPNSLQCFLGKIMRNLSLDLWRKKNSQKRGEGEFYILLSELEECIPSKTSVWDSCSEKILSDTIDAFLNTIPPKNRIVFLKRYYYCESIKEICKECGLSLPNVKIILFRVRHELKDYLEKEGYVI